MKYTIAHAALGLCTLMQQTAKVGFAASEGQLVGHGYSAPGPIEVAPGQVVTLFFRNIARLPDGRMRVARAETVPLPDKLAGLSASIHQLPQTSAYSLPLFAVRQQNECEEASGEPKCLLTAMRVQIPTELTPTVAKLTVEVDGQASRTFLVRPVRDDAHVATTCDTSWDTNPGSTCPRMAFHADGTLVSKDRPAKRGETIVMYAHGLGPTVPRVPAGTAAPVGVELAPSAARQLVVRFVPFRNANGALPRYFEAEQPASEGNTVAFAGLAPGQIGLYQMNVVVPEAVEVPIACGGDTESNVLAKVSTVRGTENIPICVEP